MFRIAIAGAGAIAGFHARAVAELADAKLVAACSRQEANATAFCEKHGGRPYIDVSRMLATEKPDVLITTTPSGAHLEPALAAAEHKVHVLCEKPLEISLSRVDRMIQACARAGVHMGGVFQQRMSPLYKAVHKACAEGRFGSPALINCYVPWWRDDAYYAPPRWQGTAALDGGGALINQSIHGVDLVQWFAQAAFGQSQPVEEVFCYSGRLAHDAALMEVEDSAVLSLRFRGGGLGQILASTSSYPGASRRFHLGGRGGSVELMEEQLVYWRFAEQCAGDEDMMTRFGASTTHSGAVRDPLAMGLSNHRLNIQSFLEALNQGQAPALDGHEARKAVAITLAAYESARSARPVRLD